MKAKFYDRVIHSMYNQIPEGDKEFIFTQIYNRLGEDISHKTINFEHALITRPNTKFIHCSKEMRQYLILKFQLIRKYLKAMDT